MSPGVSYLSYWKEAQVNQKSLKFDEAKKEMSADCLPGTLSAPFLFGRQEYSACQVFGPTAGCARRRIAA